MRGLLDRVREKPRAEEFCFMSHMRERRNNISRMALRRDDVKTKSVHPIG